MGKNVHDDVLDAALDYIRDNATKLVALTSEPTGASAYTNATTAVHSGGYMVSDVAITSADFGSNEDGDTSGRKMQVNSHSSVSTDGLAAAATATQNHVAIIDDTNSKVLYTTTSTAQTVTGGIANDYPAWDIEFRDPV
jgi:hypothetical protein